MNGSSFEHCDLIPLKKQLQVHWYWMEQDPIAEYASFENPRYVQYGWDIQCGWDVYYGWDVQ